ncbi:hypothetical protein CPB83DRAFT_899218 [Crepidotus variabilis]|uniref:DUF6533 domain-containing protein n=1 Tax=Crepidotus variabilis TaxID=179855 RepID=A0A9P6JJE4_9AGAR|nr:hypothetical protein CPB83DRAFT_899218 [Crepidotus variabilis]
MSAAPDLSQILPLVFKGLKMTRDGNYSIAAAIAVIGYDICATFFDEMQLIWGKKWSLPKVLYLLARYYGLIYLIITLIVGSNTKLTSEVFVNTLCVLFPNRFPALTSVSCRGYLYYYSYGGDIFFTSIVNAIFVIRIHALYGKSQKILALFVSLCLIEFGFELGTTYIAAKTSAESATVNPLGIPWPGCIGTALPLKLTLLAWIPCLTVATILFAFTIFKFKDALRKQAIISRSESQEKINNLSPMMVVFIRDGSLYFFLIFAILLLCTVLIVPRDEDSALPLMPWIIAVYSLSGSHLILDLRKAGQNGVNQHSDRVPDDTLPLAFAGGSGPAKYNFPAAKLYRQPDVTSTYGHSSSTSS